MSSTPRLPLIVLLVAAVLALEAGALLWLAVEAFTHLGQGVLPTGAQVFLAVLYLLVAAWIGAAAAALVRGRPWSRGATTAVQLFAALLSWWLISVGLPLVGGVLLVLSGFALVALFTTPVTRHLGGAPVSSPGR